MVAVHHYLIYVISFVHASGVQAYYYGLTGVLHGQSDKEAMMRRVAWMIEKPVFFCKNALSDFKISMVWTDMKNLRCALAWEAAQFSLLLFFIPLVCGWSSHSRFCR